MVLGDAELDMDESVADCYDVNEDNEYFLEVADGFHRKDENIEEDDLSEFDSEFKEVANENVETVDEDVMRVGQAELAYLDNELMDQLDFEGLETAVGPCYAVAVLDNDTGDMALIHADKDKVDQVRRGVNRVSNKLTGDFDEAKLVTNWGKDQDFLKVYNLLDSQICDVEVETGDCMVSKSIGVDETGFYEPDFSALPETNELEGMATKNSRTLKDRTQAAIKDQYQEQ